MPRLARASALALTALVAVTLTVPAALAGASTVSSSSTGSVSSAARAQSLPSEKQWIADVHTAMTGSNHWLDKRLKRGGSQLAVNFDIDNTALASHYDFGKPTHYVRHFAWHADRHGVALVFNTGRIQGDGHLRTAVKQLRAAGYPVTEICGRKSAEESLSHSKQRCRLHFVHEGYTLIANIGNRSTDFVGGNYGKAFRLPNYGGGLA